MKMGKKLTIGFMAIASLVGSVGIFSAISHNNIQANSRITTEVLELGILVNESLVELLALNQTENIKDYVREKTDYEQIRAEFDALFKKLDEENEKQLQDLGVNREAFHEDADQLAKISNRLIALHKRELAKNKAYKEKKSLEKELRHKIQNALFVLQDNALTRDVELMQYKSYEALYDHKDPKYGIEWLESISKIKGNSLIVPLQGTLNDLNVYERVAQDLSKVVVERETIETQKHLAFRKLQELINLLEENNERIANKVKAESQALARNTQSFMSAVVVAAFLVSIILGLIIARSISKPVSNLAQTTQAIAQGDFSVRVDVATADEIGQLAASFNKMTEDLQETTTSIGNLNREISERAKAEDRIRQQNEFLNTILESLTHPFYVIDANDYTIKMANSALYPGKLPEKTTCYMLTHKQDRPCNGSDDHCPLEEVKKTKKPVVTEHVHYDRDGNTRNVEVHAYPILDDKGKVSEIIEYTLDITERKKAEMNLKRIEWLLTKSVRSETDRKELKEIYIPPYGELSEINTSRVLLDSVKKDALLDIVGDYLDLLDTSAAVYEKNGDYTLGIFSSGWCQFLDQASRNLCDTDDNAEALKSGKWHCHESCWTKASRISIETAQPVDIECNGGLHLYAVPIWAGEEIVGSINFGYGDPPKEPQKLQEIAEKYHLNNEDLRKHAEAYESRPPYIIGISKNRLMASARLIGGIVERKQAEKEIRDIAKFPSENPNPVLRIQRDGKMLYGNDAAVPLLAKWKIKVGGVVPAKWRRLVDKAFESEKVISSEDEVDDSIFSFVIAPVADNDYANMYASNVTERRQAEAELKMAQEKLVETAHQAGMAEVAADVLHNVGNVLNSINVSTTLVTEKIANSELANLEKLANLINDHIEDLGTFLTEHPQGKHIPVYLTEVSKCLTDEQADIVSRLRVLTENVEHVKEIIGMQQSYAKISGVEVRASLAKVVEDAIQINSAGLERHGTRLIRELDELPDVEIDKQKVLQILVNLISNAKYALSSDDKEEKLLTIRLYKHGEDRFRIEVADNGVGISEENLTKIFSHGFTTKQHGHGFGLHSGALAAKEMGGSLTVYSDGVGQGATFTLKLPFKPAEVMQ